MAAPATTTATVTVVVTPVNDPPSFASGGDIVVHEDAGSVSETWATTIVTGPADEAGQGVTFTVVANSDPDLFSASPTVDTDGTVAFTTAVDAKGAATTSVVATDDGGSVNGGEDVSAVISFDIVLDPTNDPPTFVVGPDVMVGEDYGPQSVGGWVTGITPGPADEAGQMVSFDVVSNSNPTLFSDGPTVGGGGRLRFTPTADGTGSAVIVIEATDDGDDVRSGRSVTPVATITVVERNDAPTFRRGGEVSVVEDFGAYSVAWATSLHPGGDDEFGQTMLFSVVANTNPALFAVAPSVVPDGTLSLRPTPDASGSAVVDVVLVDDGGTDNGGVDTSATVLFEIEVGPVNDRPRFTSGGDVTAFRDSGPFSAGWATGISTGPPDEGGQTAAFLVVANSEPSLFATGPTVGTGGRLRFTPAEGLSGTATIDVVLVDDGGTADGGADTSAVVTFAVAIGEINDPPSFRSGGNVPVAEDSGPYAAPWATGISPGPPDEFGQTITFANSWEQQPRPVRRLASDRAGRQPFVHPHGRDNRHRADRRGGDRRRRHCRRWRGYLGDDLVFYHGWRRQ